MTEPTTAMDLVRQAQRGEISVDELIAALLEREFDPSYETTDLADDWELRENSFEAVTYAFITDLIDEEQYSRIFSYVNARGRGDGAAEGQPVVPE